MSDAPEGSLLAGIREQRKAALAALFKDVPVRGFEDPPLFVRFKPIPQDKLTKIGKAADKKGDADKIVRSNAALLVEACVGIFYKDDDGQPIGDEDDWPKFDEQLTEALGTTGTRVDAVRALYLTDGEIGSTATALIEWSGFARKNLDEQDDSGN